VVSRGTFNAFLVLVLEALRQEKQEEGSMRRSGGFAQAKLAIETSISLLQFHSKISETASLYLKVSRSLNRLLERALHDGLSHGSESGFRDNPLHQTEVLQYRWSEQQPVLQLQISSIYGGSALRSQ
jgi:hypothetical protein